ncbi:TonB-dependent receptor [Muribaculum caecicola]|uniref:TonB-dependent receptor n=2 Tax=Muribaculum TaxID=1918540 RepID=A0AC61S6J6_9BACT|nr:TonB-dependent receptor [Muribaculum caecicola]THG54294.1 TonB-dependent receptor [Muribaculum caecicola]
MKKNFLLSQALLPVIAVMHVSAADSVMSDSASVSLPDVEIVANRATKKTPVAFTEFGRAELDKSNDARDIPYLLQSTPSVVTTSDAGSGIGYTSMRIRGTDGSRINVTANGIPINNPESHNVYWVNMPDLASSLNNIQIQRGAGTSTNGAASFGATINMVTDAPVEDAYGELSGAYGAYETSRVTLRAGTGLLGGHWSADARLSCLGSDGYIERASSKLWSYFAQLAYSSRSTNIRLIAFGGKERTYMAWDYASKEDMEKYGRRYNPCGKYTDSDGNTAYYPDQYDNYIQHHLQLHLLQRLGDYWRINAALHYTADDGYYNQYKTSRTLKEYGLDPFYNAEGQLVEKSDLVRLKNNENGFGGATFSATYERGPLRVVSGGAANYFKGNHFGQVAWVRNYIGSVNPLQEYYRNKGKKFDSNIYVRANYDFLRHFSAYADLQLRHIHYTIKGVSDNYDYAADAPAMLDIHRDWNFFNPKFGINFSTGAHRAFMSMSVAHKEPTRDNFTDADPSRMPDAETLYDYEAGYSFSASAFTLGANIYYMYYRDQLVATGELSDTGNPISVNVPSSYRAGIELQAAVKPCKWFEWQANATLSRNRIKNFVEYIYEDEWTNPITFNRGNTPIAFSPDFIFNNAFNFSFLKNAEASFTSHYVSSQYMNNAKSAEAKLDSYFVSNLHLAYTFKKITGVKSLRVGLSVYNVFSEKYFNNGYAGAGYYVENGEKVIYRYAGYAAQAPAHVMATVMLRF